MDKHTLLPAFIFCKQKKPDNYKVKILGIPVLSKKTTGYTAKSYFLGLRYKTTFLMQSFLQDTIDTLNVPKQADTPQEFTQAQNRLMLMDSIGEMLSAYRLHQENFLHYKNTLQGKDVVLVATGPSVTKYTPMENAIHIGVNKAFAIDRIKFDILFLQDFNGSKSYIEDFCTYPADKFLGMLSNIFPPSIIPESIALRHKIKRYRSAHPGELSHPVYDISTSPLWDAYSIVFPTLQFIFWTNPKRIYLVGCDCSQGYWDDKDAPQSATHMITGWKEIKKFADVYYPETEVISINPVGLRGLFNDMYTEPT